MQDLINFLVDLVASWGYAGIVFLMALESSFFPFPSEVVMIPAGYLAQQGQMNIILAFICGVFGSLLGAVFNYYLCYFFGRELIVRYGHFVGINEQKMQKFEAFFNKHGEISTFNCRLLPGIRQYISLPAGLAKMNIWRFCLFTSLGASIWVAILLGLGYVLGENKELIDEYLHIIIMILACFVIVLSAIYVLKYRKKRLNTDVERF